MQAKEVEIELGDAPQQLRRLFRIDAELPRAAAHFHAGRLQFKIRVHPQHHSRPQPQGVADPVRAVGFAHRLQVQHGAGGDNLAQFGIGFSRSRKADLARCHAGVQRRLQFSAGSHVQAIDQAGHVLHQRRHRVGLERVMQAQAGGQRRAQIAHARRQQGAVIGKEGGAADAFGQARQGDAADVQAAVARRKAGLRSVPGFVLVHA